jgi:HK97 gp10 family phage protein
MSNAVTFKVEGMKEFEDLLKEIQDDFGEKDTKKILQNAVKHSMGHILNSAKNLVPVDTGALRASLRLEVRKPTRKDKRSKYVENSDIIIGNVTTAPGNVLAKTKFLNVKTGQKQKGIKSDARAIVNEFGTAKIPAKPYLRPAMESQAPTTVSSLSNSLKMALDKYKAKQAKKG